MTKKRKLAEPQMKKDEWTDEETEREREREREESKLRQKQTKRLTKLTQMQKDKRR